MRFTLFVVGEGVRSTACDAMWATHTADGQITDASLSARKKGVRSGMTVRSAQALVQGLRCELEGASNQDGMEAILRALVEATPWVERIGPDTCLVQVSGLRPPMREIRGLIEQIRLRLHEEQRILVGMASTPHLARTLVAWSRIERVPDALYWRVERHPWLIAPDIAATLQGASFPMLPWLSRLPIPAFWPLSEKERTRLFALGIYRLGDLSSLPKSYLIRQFGREALLWIRWLDTLPTGALRVNYPHPACTDEWLADVMEAVDGRQMAEIVRQVAGNVSESLRQSGLGTLRLVLEWESETTSGSYEHTFKEPVASQEALLAGLQPGLQLDVTEKLTAVRLMATRLQTLVSVQLPLHLEVSRVEISRADTSHARMNGAEDGQAHHLQRIVRHLNRKFPGGLRYGIRPSFRELRLQAVHRWS